MTYEEQINLIATKIMGYTLNSEDPDFWDRGDIEKFRPVAGSGLLDSFNPLINEKDALTAIRRWCAAAPTKRDRHVTFRMSDKSVYLELWENSGGHLDGAYEKVADGQDVSLSTVVTKVLAQAAKRG